MAHRIAIIGAGALGSALTTLLAAAGHETVAWDIDPSKLAEPRELPEVLSTAELVLLCVPTAAIREVGRLAAEQLQPSAIVISLSKGLDRDSGQTVDAILDESFPGQATGLLSGPMLAAELAAGKVGAGVLATRDRATFSRVAELISGTNLVIEYSSDLRGVAWCGVLKNVYALGLGIANGLDLGENARGWLMSHALSEMAVLLPRLGGQAETLFTVAGVGDAIATALSTTSRNHQYGVALARGETPSYQAEGALALPKLVEQVGSLAGLPLLEVITAVVQEAADPSEAFTGFQTIIRR